MKSRLLIASSVISAALVIGACSGSSDHGTMDMGDSTSASEAAPIAESADFNKVDVGFAQGMIPHHAQAVEMADMAIDSSTNTDVLELARAIKGAQQPEIDQMTGWLIAWGQKVPEASGSHDMTGMDSMMMSGMMTDADMQRLEDSSGSAFDRLWLELMVLHHEGAVAMSEDEIAGGKSPEAVTLAGTIVEAQQAEIATMNKLIASMPS
jgi:uncharacterized protein (DUF305 family)